MVWTPQMLVVKSLLCFGRRRDGKDSETEGRITGSGGLLEILSDLSLIRRLEDDHLHRHLHIQLIEFVQHY